MKYDAVLIEKMKRLRDELDHKIGTWVEDPNREYGAQDEFDLMRCWREVMEGLRKAARLEGRVTEEFDGVTYVLFKTMEVGEKLDELMEAATAAGFRGKWKMNSRGFWVEL